MNANSSVLMALCGGSVSALTGRQCRITLVDGQMAQMGERGPGGTESAQTAQGSAAVSSTASTWTGSYEIHLDMLVAR